MNLRIWIPCILLIVILIVVCRAYFIGIEGFQVNSTRLSTNDSRIRFWAILNEDKAGSSSGSSSGSGSGSGSGPPSTHELLSQVMNPGPNDTFKLVFPKYISMYALATYNNNPVAARQALLDNFDTMQTELSQNVDQELDKRTAFAANPKAESCKLLNTLTMSLYGKLVAIHMAAEDISGNEVLAESLHRENIAIQNKSACMNQTGTPSPACIALARLDEQLFPLLPAYNTANMSILTNGVKIQNTIDLLLQAYMGMNCLPVGGSASGGSDKSPLSISSVFSSDYLNNLPIIDTASFNEALQELSPYYVSTNIINFISGQLVGTAEFTSALDTTDAYIKDMAKTTNSIVSLNSMLEAGQFFNEAGSGPIGIDTCPPGYYCPSTSTMPLQCPIGYYCPAGTTEDPIQCPVERGIFTAMGASKITDCMAMAPLGYYIDSVTKKVVQCPAGYYCINNTRYECPPGTYNMKMGMGNILSCNPCPKGSYCSSPTKVYSCDIGTYNPVTNASSSSACLPCTPGHYCPQKGVVDPPPCLAGTFSNMLTSSASASGSGSGSGTGAKGAGLSCTPVSPGYYLPDTGNITDALKVPCSAGGYYCPGGTGAPQMCPAGSYCPGSGSGSASGSGLSTPTLCPAGTYGSSGGLATASCTGKCTGGYVCPIGSTSATVVRCPSGYYCPEGSGAGIPCPAGSWCPVGSVNKILCPSETYNSLGQQTAIDACKPCPAGKKCIAGTATPVPCPIGYYCQEGLPPFVCPTCTSVGMSGPP